MSTMKDVAALAGVSVGTVSHVVAGSARVSDRTRARVEEAIRRLRYRPNHIARSLKSRKTRTIGMIVSDITNPFFPEMVRGAEDAVLARGYFLSTFNTDDQPERERQIFELLEMRRADGLLVVTALRRGAHPHLDRAIESGTAVVCLDRRPLDLSVDTVTVENSHAVEVAVRHLIATGCRRIAFFGASTELYVAPDRVAGYRRAMRAAGLARLEYPGDFRRESARQLALQVLAAPPRPDAIFTVNILTVMGVLEAMHELGLECPRDLSLATFDAIPFLRGFSPRLTCVAQPNYQMGFQAANLLMDRLENKLAAPQPRHIVLPCQLVIGESTPPRPAPQP